MPCCNQKCLKNLLKQAIVFVTGKTIKNLLFRGTLQKVIESFVKYQAKLWLSFILTVERQAQLRLSSLLKISNYFVSNIKMFEGSDSNAGAYPVRESCWTFHRLLLTTWLCKTAAFLVLCLSIVISWEICFIWIYTYIEEPLFKARSVFNKILNLVEMAEWTRLQAKCIQSIPHDILKLLCSEGSRTLDNLNKGKVRMASSELAITSTVNVQAASNLTAQYLYIGFAVAVLLANVTIGLVLAQNKEFFKKSALLIALAFGDSMLGIGTVIAGVLRLGYLQGSTLVFDVHPSYCLKTFTTLLIVGVQLPSVMILLMSCERVVAIVFFSWYYQNWNTRKAWYLVAAGVFFCTISISMSWVVVYSLPENATTQINCGTAAAVGPTYASYHFYLGACCGVLSTCITLFSLIVFINKRKRFQISANDRLKKHIKREWQITIATTVIACLDLCLVVVPNILLSIAVYYPSLLLLASYATCLLCLRSTSNLFIYLTFNSDFRSRFLFCANVNVNNSINPT